MTDAPSLLASRRGAATHFPTGIEPMSTSRWPVAALICSLLAMPAISKAQATDSTNVQVKDQAKDFLHDVLKALLGPNWNLFAHGGATTSDRFLLQQAVG